MLLLPALPPLPSLLPSLSSPSPPPLSLRLSSSSPLLLPSLPPCLLLPFLPYFCPSPSCLRASASLPCPPWSSDSLPLAFLCLTPLSLSDFSPCSASLSSLPLPAPCPAFLTLLPLPLSLLLLCPCPALSCLPVLSLFFLLTPLSLLALSLPPLLPPSLCLLFSFPCPLSLSSSSAPSSSTVPSFPAFLTSSCLFLSLPLSPPGSCSLTPLSCLPAISSVLCFYLLCSPTLASSPCLCLCPSPLSACLPSPPSLSLTLLSPPLLLTACTLLSPSPFGSLLSPAYSSSAQLSCPVPSLLSFLPLLPCCLFCLLPNPCSPLTAPPPLLSFRPSPLPASLSSFSSHPSLLVFCFPLPLSTCPPPPVTSLSLLLLSSPALPASSLFHPLPASPLLCALPSLLLLLPLPSWSFRPLETFSSFLSTIPAPLFLP
ncbi:hypothetical protein C7M84_010067 [Penaeus vannamei]|uniref:Uncharacterized protein n=1 Tax=Penaeus vannamei TaxID=6689 RepID=A0A423T524_PENVA|nr:hypothetical protein C7M84_010067 [Penaeus vannamei]